MASLPACAGSNCVPCAERHSRLRRRESWRLAQFYQIVRIQECAHGKSNSQIVKQEASIPSTGDIHEQAVEKRGKKTLGLHPH